MPIDPIKRKSFIAVSVVGLFAGRLARAEEKEHLVGAPGKEVWTFKALKAGMTTIEFKYVQPWEKDKAPAETKSFSVVVKPEK